MAFLLWSRPLLLLLALMNGCCGTVTTSFTPEELEYFVSLNLCSHFGGGCGTDCPHRYIRHKWGVPLCPLTVDTPLECCIGPPSQEELALDDEESQQDAMSSASPTTTTTTTTSTAATAPPTAPPTTPPMEGAADSGSTSCGLMGVANSRRKRIVGGAESSPGRWPWLVALRSMLGAHTCSGALIDQRWVVTAAHCFKFVSNPGLWRVRLGEFNLLEQEVGERDVAIERILLHPEYRIRSPSDESDRSNETLYSRYVHDIALLRLSERADREPICLPEAREGPDDQQEVTNEIADDQEELERAGGQSHGSTRRRVTTRHGYVDNRIANGQFVGGHSGRRVSRNHDDHHTTVTGSPTCWVAGWGVTRDSSNDDQTLHEVSGHVIDSERCGQMWGVQLEEDMLCFGDGTYGPCAGDSGGPLSCEQTPGSAFYLTGVVSWGTEDCNVSGYPSVFTHVHPYLGWIRNITGRE